ncbi:MAG: TipAS antibiotic-recognition domain-containing protein, partial [Rhodoglobus sp.]
RIGSNGYRYYDEDALARLQRILMLRELGLGIPAIGDVLKGQRDNAQALLGHLHWLQEEKNRLDRQIASVETTIMKMEGGEQLMAEEMFDGFDNSQYREEVEERWGKKAYADSNRWWSAKSKDEKQAWQVTQKQLASDWIAAAASRVAAESPEAQALAKRHADWLGSIPGTPGYGSGAPAKAYFVGLGEMYVLDDRFAANYGGTAGATFVRDAMAFYAEKHL